MRKTIFRGLTLMTAMASMNACKKSDTADDTRTQFLTKSAWKVVASRKQKNGGSWTDTYSSLSACQRDNTVTFSTTGSIVFDEGATKCNSTDSQVIPTGPWRFTANETKIEMSYIGQNLSLEIIQLDAITLKTSKQETSSGDVYTDETTFSH